MKTIQTRTAAVLLIVAGSMIPAFAQDRNNGRDRGQGRENRPQQQRDTRGDDRRGGGQQMRQRASQPQSQQPQSQQPQYQGRQDNFRQDRQQYRQPQGNQQNYNQQSLRNYGRQGYADQNYRQQNYYGPQNSYRNGGSSFGFRSGGSLRWTDRGGYRGRFIPQNRFYGSFGRDHFFRLGRPVYYNGYSRFSYGGYGFQLIDPVPAYWGQDWYDSDDVYVDYEDDGYYMYNRSYPGVGIAINVDF